MLNESERFVVKEQAVLLYNKYSEELYHQANEKIDGIRSDLSRRGLRQSGFFIEAVSKTLYETLRQKIFFKIRVMKELLSQKTTQVTKEDIGWLFGDFEKTQVHSKIVEAIKACLKKHGIEGLRADDKEYHDDLLYNIITYIHGCSFGVAVFEKIETNEYNPNVSLEVGYMMGLKKPVCLLKDESLGKLQTDLLGKPYKDFNASYPDKTVSDQIEVWLSDKGIISH